MDHIYDLVGALTTVLSVDDRTLHLRIPRRVEAKKTDIVDFLSQTHRMFLVCFALNP